MKYKLNKPQVIIDGVAVPAESVSFSQDVVKAAIEKVEKHLLSQLPLGAEKYLPTSTGLLLPPATQAAHGASPVHEQFAEMQRQVRRMQQRQKARHALAHDTYRNLPPEFSVNRQFLAIELAEAFLDFAESIGLTLAEPATHPQPPGVKHGTT